jgi:CheY-like chemotaxis protein
VVLRVEDTGVGMSAEVRERAFEPFFTTKPQGQGTGLGLTMVYGIVQQHGGTVRVESEPGHGARFEVSWPATSMRTSRPSDAPVPRVLGGSETILVAEDEAGVRGGVVRLLENAGYRVLVAAHGEEAVEVFRGYASEIALALLDIVMPRLGGSVAAMRMREIRADLPVVLTSGHGHVRRLDVTHVPGALHLDKPYPSEALLRIVREALDRPPAGSDGSPR